MENYLVYRWPGSAPPTPPEKGRVLLTVLKVVGIVLGLILLGVAVFFTILWGLNATMGETQRPVQSHPPLPSHQVEQPQSGRGWSQEDLPWGTPNPDVDVVLTRQEQPVRTAQEIYQQVLPSVVRVETAGAEGYGVGSGVILTQDGYIATNYHVIEEGTALSVMLLADQTYHDAVVIGVDEELDLAIIKIEAAGLTPAVLGDSDELQVGDTVYAIGNPLGYLYGSMSDGIVSALSREVEVGGNDMTLIQTTIPLNSGNSGGALVDVRGRVVGITSAKITGVMDDTVTEGIGLAIPVTDSLPFLNYMLHTGDTCRPGIGVQCQISTQGLVQTIEITAVTPGGPADGVLQPGDVVVSVDGEKITTFYQMTRALYSAGVGGQLEMTVLRHGEEQTVTLVLYDRLAQ